MHVDEFIERPNIDVQDQGLQYARFVLHLFRLPAEMQFAFSQWTDPFKLFCTFEGERYRVTGASRLGDVWLTSNFDQSHGYEKRVDVASCSAWGAEP